MDAMIEQFRGPYRFLSNFYPLPRPLSYQGLDYPTVEHAFQAAKTPNHLKREYVRDAPTPGIAKARGRVLGLRPDWEHVKVQVMRELLRQKFAQEPLRSKLLATGHAVLQEGNHWHDRFWGVDLGTRTGKNMLGKLLMELRTALRKEIANGIAARAPLNEECEKCGKRYCDHTEKY